MENPDHQMSIIREKALFLGVLKYFSCGTEKYHLHSNIDVYKSKMECAVGSETSPSTKTAGLIV